MDRITKILMNRDGITKEEAEDIVKETKEMINEAIENGDYSEAEEIFMDELGLEIDYMIDVLL